uniref:MULE transposase domain-containing protein n=1 Tax=Cajanus cajan TaxID=3821 RepID=A0A151SGR4_CAJCA|nr:hypothetical protein KK1_000200 [Cajanus cajan]
MAKQKAIEDLHGNWEQSYHDLPKLLNAMSGFLNGFVVEKQTRPLYNQQGEMVHHYVQFHRVFWTFKPCIDGFKYCKPIVQLDGTFLYGKYKGTLLEAVAQDGNNKIFPIAFAIVEGETADAWFLFLHYLKIHVCPQDDLCLISDRHESMKAAYARQGSGWTPDNSVHVFCIRHIAQNLMRHFKNTERKKLIINMAYGMTEPRFNYYYNTLTSEPEIEGVIEWLNTIPKEQWTLAWDGGRRWGHMTTNLAEAINSILKKTRNLSIFAIIMSTYKRCNASFIQRGKKVNAKLRANQIYTEIIKRAMTETFTVKLHDKWCDYGKFQKLHMPCSHVVAECKHVHHDYKSYIDQVYTLQYISNVYNELFGELPNESYWSNCKEPQIIPNPEKIINKKGRPKSSRIRTEMDMVEPGQPKRCSLYRNVGHSKKKCPYCQGSSSHQA